MAEIVIKVTDEDLEGLRRLAAANNASVDRVVVDAALRRVRATPGEARELFAHLTVLGHKVRSVAQAPGLGKMAKVEGVLSEIGLAMEAVHARYLSGGGDREVDGDD
jgi:hypothetical protein